MLSHGIGKNAAPFPQVQLKFQENNHWENYSRHCGSEVYCNLESDSICIFETLRTFEITFYVRSLLLNQRVY
jgi:hypothetical protein